MNFLLLILICTRALWANAFTLQDNSDPSVSEMKPGIVYYSYKTIPYKEWNGAEKEVLNLHKDYKEPTLIEEKGGVRGPRFEPLMMFVAKMKFIVDRRAINIDLKRFLDPKMIQSLDSQVDHQVIQASDVITYKNQDMGFRNPPLPARWCDDQSRTLCLKSHYNFPSIMQAALALGVAYKGSKDANFDMQSEVRISMTPAEIKDAESLKAVTGVNAPPAATLSQNFFWFSHFCQYGKVLGVLQPHPTQPDKTIVTGYTVFGIEKKWWDLNMGFHVKDIILGKRFNTTEGIGMGLPKFTQVKALALAEELSR